MCAVSFRLIALLEPVLQEVFGQDKERLTFSLWLPQKVLGAKDTVARLLGKDMDADFTWKEILVHRATCMVQVFALREHGRRLYRSLVYCSDTRFSLLSLDPASNDRSQVHTPSPLVPAHFCAYCFFCSVCPVRAWHAK